MKRAEKYVFYDAPDGRMVAEFFNARVYLHLEIREWGMASMRKLRGLWPEVKCCLAKIGLWKVYAYNYETDQTWPRFMALFGFRRVRNRAGWLLMECDLA